MNKVILIGNLTKDPELRTTQGGKSNCNFTLAISGRNKTVEYVKCVAWEKTAENIAKFMSKGKRMGVEGRIQTRDYEKDGRKVYVTEVICTEVEFLSPMSDPEGGHRRNDPKSSYVPPTPKEDEPDDFEPLSDDQMPF